MLFNYSIAEADRCGEMLSKSRVRSGLSRKAMSEALDVSESTIKAWENGQGSPTLHGIMRWFRAAGDSPYRHMMDFFWPNVFPGLTPQSPDEEIRKAGKFYFTEVAGPMEIQKLHYLIFGDHGSEWSGLLDMVCAHLHTSVSSRYRVAEIIQVSYEMSVAAGHASMPDEIGADRTLLLSAIAAAKEASSAAGKRGYTIIPPFSEDEQACSNLLARARIDAGATQKELAKALGKTEHTIHNWESGYSPSFLELCTWFRVLNMPAWTYIQCTLFPNEKLVFHEDDEKRRNEVIDYLTTSSSQTLRKMFYLVAGAHGSNWLAVLEMMFEHVCSPLAQRVISARSVLIGYQLDASNLRLRDVEHILPDLGNLNRCIALGTEAAKQGLTRYKDPDRSFDPPRDVSA